MSKHHKPSYREDLDRELVEVGGMPGPVSKEGGVIVVCPACGGDPEKPGVLAVYAEGAMEIMCLGCHGRLGIYPIASRPRGFFD